MPRFLCLMVLSAALAFFAPTLARADDATQLAQALAAGAQKTGPQRSARIEAELVPMSAWAVPGSTAIIAIKQTIAPDWHTYWRNPGDSGGPTEVQWSLPRGFEAGSIIWPLPQRQRIQTLMNYGYSGTVYLPVPVQVPADAALGQTVRVSAQALFLVCSDQLCEPHEFTLALDLQVQAGAPPLNGTQGQAIEQVMEQAPRGADVTAHIALKDGVLALSAAGEPLAGQAPKWAYFYPHDAGIIDHAAPQTGQRGAQGVSLMIHPSKAVAASGLTGAVGGVLATDLGAWEINASIGAAIPGTTGQGTLADGEGDAASKRDGHGFIKVALFALLGGLILNLMPCVFPVLAMKAAALSRTAHNPHEARRDGIGFLAGVLTSFVALAGLLLALRAGGQAVGWGFQLQSPAVTAGLCLLMLAVGLNMSGLFHVGGSLQGVGGQLASQRGGAVGAFLTGVLAVVVAAPCTAPFMALALGAALVMPWPQALLVFVMLGLGLALPYVMISFSPRILARLPKPGGWMETLRNLLAFPMYGAALWLAWVFARQTGEALGLLFCAALMVAFTLWLLGRFQDTGGRAVLIAAIGSALVSGALCVVSMASPVVATQDAKDSHAVVASAPWSPQAVEQARAQGRPVLVNFTADWCVTCKINERAALSSARTAQVLENANAVYLVADWTTRDDQITAALESHGRSGVPLYLVYVPGQEQPRVLPQLLSEGVIAKALQPAA